MINYRLDAVNGGKKPTLSQMAKRQKPAEDAGMDIAKVARLMAEDAQREMNESANMKDGVMILKMESLYKEMELERSRYQTLESQRNTEADLFSQMKEQMASQLHEASEMVKKLIKEIDTLKTNERLLKDDADMSVSLQRTLVRDMETKLSQTFGKLAQSEKQNRELMEAARQMQKPMHSATKIPAFEFTPVKDRDGKIVKLTATPIGG